MYRRDTDDPKHFYVTVVQTYHDTFWVEARDEDEAFEQAMTPGLTPIAHEYRSTYDRDDYCEIEPAPASVRASIPPKMPTPYVTDHGELQHDASQDLVHQHDGATIPPRGSTWDVFETPRGLEPERHDCDEDSGDAALDAFGRMDSDDPAVDAACHLLMNYESARVRDMRELTELYRLVLHHELDRRALLDRIAAILERSGFSP